MLTAKIKRKSNLKDFDKKLQEGTSYALEKVMQFGQEEALQRKKGIKDKDMILYEIAFNNGFTEGKLYTNFDWALFLEYGTGTYAEMPHIGMSDVFFQSGFKFWYAPAKSVEKHYLPTDFMVVNGVFYPMMLEVNGEIFVIVFEQKPKPYMRPTAFILENKAVEIFKKELSKYLRK